MGTFIDQKGKKFGHITVLEKDIDLSKEKNRIYWVCQCDCGRIKSIRGDNLKKIKTCGKCANDLTGQKFGRLIVLEKGKIDFYGHQYWICQCSCGNTTEINADNLKRGLTKSCGCLHSEIIHQRVFKDITNQRFGKLIAKKYFIKQGKTYWICKCDCGNICNVAGGNLTNGHTQSCGCINYSIGEAQIAMILQNNNINFIKEYSPKDLKINYSEIYGITSKKNKNLKGKFILILKGSYDIVHFSEEFLIKNGTLIFFGIS